MPYSWRAISLMTIHHKGKDAFNKNKKKVEIMLTNSKRRLKFYSHAKVVNKGKYNAIL